AQQQIAGSPAAAGSSAAAPADPIEGPGKAGAVVVGRTEIGWRAGLARAVRSVGQTALMGPGVRPRVALAWPADAPWPARPLIAIRRVLRIAEATQLRPTGCRFRVAVAKRASLEHRMHERCPGAGHPLRGLA